MPQRKQFTTSMKLEIKCPYPQEITSSIILTMVLLIFLCYRAHNLFPFTLGNYLESLSDTKASLKLQPNFIQAIDQDMGECKRKHMFTNLDILHMEILPPFMSALGIS